VPVAGRIDTQSAFLEDKMKDSEARGLVLRRLYDIRHESDGADARDLEGVLPIDPKILPNILDQLAQQNLVTWKPLRSGMGAYLAFMARITAFGVNVIEGTAAAPITITVDSSVNVQGSQNVQIGHGNVQTVTMDIGKMINAVDGSDASASEKAEAKSLLKQIGESKLVQEMLRKFLLGK
jgi:hypothetical protein